MAVFFGVDEGVEQVRQGERDLYLLQIDLLYSTDEDAEVALEAAERAVAFISAAFRERCFDAAAGWKGIELVGCDAVSDEAMTYAMSTQLKRWNMDYLSLRADPPAEPITRGTEGTKDGLQHAFECRAASMDLEREAIGDSADTGKVRNLLKELSKK